MNGYKKMKRLAGMKVLKVVSAVTAMSMAVTTLAVSASANAATPDVIYNALGDLKNYGIVADSFISANHFESNFAVNKVVLNNNFDLDNYVNFGKRKINIKVTTEETFAPGETKTYYYGVFSGGKLIDVVYGGKAQNGIIGIEFTEAGEKSFTVVIPEEYRYETVTIYKMDPVVTDNGVQYTTSEAGVDFLPEASSREEMLKKVSESIVGSTMTAGNSLIGENKILRVSPEIFADILKENDGRYSYKGSIFANASNKIESYTEASARVGELLAAVKKASETLSKFDRGSSNVLYLDIKESIGYGSEAEKLLSQKFQQVKDNPELTLLVNVDMGENANFEMYFHSPVDNWDVETGSRIVFNFTGGISGITVIRLGDGFRGTVIAPNARVINDSSVLGAVYTSEFTNLGGEIHKATYGGSSDFYQAYYYDKPETTTVPETTTTPEEEVTTEATTEVTEPEETTPEETEETTEETTTADTEPVLDGSSEETTTEEPEESTTAPETEATTSEETTTTTTEEVTTPEVTTTTTTEEVTTPEVTTTTTTEEVTTPEETTITTTEEATTPEVTTTTTTEEATTPEVTTTTTTEEEVTTPEDTTSEDITSAEEPEETTVPEADETEPEDTTPEETTTTILIEIEEDTPRDELIIIDEDVPLGETPMKTGVDRQTTVFIAIGCFALLLGVGAQVYSVILKKQN